MPYKAVFSISDIEILCVESFSRRRQFYLDCRKIQERLELPVAELEEIIAVAQNRSYLSVFEQLNFERADVIMNLLKLNKKLIIDYYINKALFSHPIEELV